MRNFKRLLIAGALALCVGVPAQADQVITPGSKTFDDGNGFFSGSKSFWVYTADDPVVAEANAPAGSLVYVYTITNNGTSVLGLIGFTIDVAAGSVLASDISWSTMGAGVQPVSAILETNATAFDVVNFTWGAPGAVLAPGDVSSQLFVISTYSPGSVTDNMYGVEGQFSFDAGENSCVGPLTPPAEDGDPNPCTIGWWKNRYDEKQGTTQFFPDPDFQQVVDAAVILSGGLFTSGTAGGDCGALGFDDLFCALSSKGKRTIEERGRQQLAATYLNLAAGDLFPDNLKCALFEGNSITSNACGDAITVGDAVNQAGIDILDPLAEHDAHECSDDLNNGIGVTP